MSFLLLFGLGEPIFSQVSCVQLTSLGSGLRTESSVMRQRIVSVDANSEILLSMFGYV